MHIYYTFLKLTLTRSLTTFFDLLFSIFIFNQSPWSASSYCWSTAPAAAAVCTAVLLSRKDCVVTYKTAANL